MKSDCDRELLLCHGSSRRSIVVIEHIRDQKPDNLVTRRKPRQFKCKSLEKTTRAQRILQARVEKLHKRVRQSYILSFMVACIIWTDYADSGPRWLARELERISGRPGRPARDTLNPASAASAHPSTWYGNGRFEFRRTGDIENAPAFLFVPDGNLPAEVGAPMF